ncbi:hypothetical protein KKB10_06465 [Patescibacteria group bacterium]|nr:hypothetical protein [Patescibacteria group bacterium]MBU1075457.1 hypothetical protein [Patescibacteria group bacterium]MBU1952201.1 hypothetical protein [Patescibacteria group bacterium]
MSQEKVKKIQELIIRSDLNQAKKQDLLVRLQALAMLNESKDDKLAMLFEMLYQRAQSDIYAVEEFFSGLQDFFTSYIKEGQAGARKQLGAIEGQIPGA